MVRPGDLPLRLEPALALGLPARGAARRRASRGCSCSPTRRSGSTRASGWARRCARCSTPSGAPTSSSSPPTGSTSREGRSPSSSPRRARPGTAALLRGLRENGEREVRLVGTDMSERSIGRHLCDAFHLVPAGSDSGLRGRGARRRRARARGRGAAAVLVRPRGPRRAPRPLPGAGARLLARHDPPLERQGRDVRAAAAARGHRARLPARQRRGRGRRRPRASSAIPTAPSASSPSSRPARAASGSSTRPSTARTSSCTSGPARSRCGWRRRSSCCPTRVAPTCS